jgi:hypothetical protein
MTATPRATEAFTDLQALCGRRNQVEADDSRSGDYDVIPPPTAALPMDPFFEPVSIVVVEESQKKTLRAVGADDLRCWCHHIGFSTRAHLRSIKEATIHEIARGRLLPRSHLESSALAVHCLDILSECIDFNLTFSV